MTTFDDSPESSSPQMELFQTSSLGDSPARTLAQPAAALASLASVPPSGSNSPDLLGIVDLATSSLRMLQFSLHEDWIGSSWDLPRSGMMRSGSVFRLQPLALPTDAIAYGSSPIPTPTEGDAKASGSRNTADSKAHPGTSLTDYVRQDGGRGRTWRTPGTGDADRGYLDHEKIQQRWAKRRQTMLCDQVIMYPTPAATYGTANNGCPGDGREEYRTKGKPSLETMARKGMWPTPTAALPNSKTAPWKDGVPWWQQSRASRHLEAIVNHPERMWPTPAERDYRYPNATSYSERGGGTKGEQLPNSAGGPLNPAWVEWLMGFPEGWLDL